MSRPLSVDDVHRLLVERIRSGAFPVGTKLPSVRTMAEEFGSNASTVDRALHRLAQAGIVRTVPRQGTYVSATDLPRGVGGEDARIELVEKALVGLRASGMTAADVRELVERVIDDVYKDPKIAFVECNTFDLEQMAETVTNATGVDLIPLLLDDIPDELDSEFDAIAVPLFHITELNGHVGNFSKVVELNFQPSPQALRRLAMLNPSLRVVVSAPTERGMERMSGLTRQFFLGRVDIHHSLKDDPDVLRDYDAIVYTHAAQLDPATLADIPHPVLIEWELDPASSASFRSRVEAAVRS